MISASVLHFLDFFSSGGFRKGVLKVASVLEYRARELGAKLFRYKHSFMN